MKEYVQGVTFALLGVPGGSSLKCIPGFASLRSAVPSGSILKPAGDNFAALVVPLGLILKIQKPHAGVASLDFISLGPLKKASFLREPSEIKYPGCCRGVFVLICSPARNRTWI